MKAKAGFEKDLSMSLQCESDSCVGTAGDLGVLIPGMISLSSVDVTVQAFSFTATQAPGGKGKERKKVDR